MRKMHLSLLALFLFSSLHGQNVGIGTLLPQTKLHVNGGNDQFFRIHSTGMPFSGGADVGIQMTRTAFFGSPADWQILNQGHLTFNTATDEFTSNSGVERMRLTTDGFLGLGSTSPTERLHVRGNGDQYIRIDAYNLGGLSSKKAGLRLTTDGIGSTDWQLLNGGTLKFASSSDNFSSGDGTVRMSLNSAGYLGIGTATPKSAVHIAIGEEVNLTDDGHLLLGQESTANLIMDENEILARNGSSGADLFVQRDGGDLILCAMELGGVGIGVLGGGSIPSGYLLAVDGKIISEEIRVDMSGSWPDYVFEQSYTMPTLFELEKQIEEKGHLPGIPSAEEVESDGQMVGDIQRRLLEKIEELTLYTIQQEKAIESLRQEIHSLKTKLK